MIHKLVSTNYSGSKIIQPGDVILTDHPDNKFMIVLSVNTAISPVGEYKFYRSVVLKQDNTIDTYEFYTTALLAS